MRISDLSSDVCSSVLLLVRLKLELSRVTLNSVHQPLLAAIAAASQREGMVPEPHSGLRNLLARVGETTLGLWLQTRMFLGFIGLSLNTLLRSVIRPRRLRITAMVHHIQARSEERRVGKEGVKT